MKELEAIRDFARELSEHSDMHIHSKDLMVKAAAAVEGICADRIKALLPALDTALREKSADKATVLTMRMLRTELDSARAEVAALRELMPCGHPTACLNSRYVPAKQFPESAGGIERYCTACAEIAALTEKMDRARIEQMNVDIAYKDKCVAEAVHEAVEILISIVGEKEGSHLRCGFCFITIDENGNPQHESGCPEPNARKFIAANRGEAMTDTEWRILHRPIAISVYEEWKRIERMIAAKNGISIPDIDTLERKNSSEACASFTALYECLVVHFQHLTEEEWQNF